MQEFEYVALSVDGRRQRAVILAASEVEALRLLEERRLQVVSLTARRVQRAAASGVKVTPEAVAALVGELATLLEAGVPLAEAVETLSRAHGDDHPLARILLAIRGGGAFSVAMADSGLRLPDFVLQLVRAGEATGHLAEALRAASAHVEAELQFSREARNALMYPMVLVGSGILATLVMFVFVVPRFASILDNPRAELPMMSRWVLGAGLWLTQHQLIVGVVLAGLVTLSVWAAQRGDVRAAAWELAAKLPVLGQWTWHAEIGRWASLFAVLLQSRVPLLTALGQANETFRRQRLRSQSALVLADVRGGKSLSQALTDHAVLDGAGLNLIKVGERAGSLPQTVGSLAKIHVEHSQHRLKRFLVLLEPIAILLISLLLGGIMISVMLAITSLTNVL
jgi:general secretion pathway protein F